MTCTSPTYTCINSGQIFFMMRIKGEMNEMYRGKQKKIAEKTNNNAVCFSVCL